MARNGSLVITGLREPVAPVVVMMGVAGTGKSAVGSAFAEATGWAFLDADDFHPEANLRKMRSGVPLTDADRWPWLEDLSQVLRDHQGRGERCVLACSALKQSYRALLEEAAPSARWFHLHGPSDLNRVAAPVSFRSFYGRRDVAEPAPGFRAAQSCNSSGYSVISRRITPMCDQGSGGASRNLMQNGLCERIVKPQV